MKSAILAATIASCAAFAPAQTVSIHLNILGLFPAGERDMQQDTYCRCNDMLTFLITMISDPLRQSCGSRMELAFAAQNKDGLR